MRAIPRRVPRGARATESRQPPHRLQGPSLEVWEANSREISPIGATNPRGGSHVASARSPALKHRTSSTTSMQLDKPRPFAHSAPARLGPGLRKDSRAATGGYTWEESVSEWLIGRGRSQLLSREFSVISLLTRGAGEATLAKRRSFQNHQERENGSRNEAISIERVLLQ